MNKPQVPFLELIDLVSERVGGRTVSTSDDFFAPKENLLKFEPAVFIPGKYTEFGKWMDGWESRRKRNLGPENDHDWCIIRLGLAGKVHGINVDTAFFTGNFPEFCALDACISENDPTLNSNWVELLPKSRLHGGSENLFPILNRERWTHIRLRIIPDGGVARLRVYGEVVPDLKKIQSKDEVDLIGADNGAVVVACNDMYFGQKENLIFPGRAKTMGEGWETRRKRGPVTPDWIVIRSGFSGKVNKIEVDTNHFKGNFPESCLIEGLSYKARDLEASDFRDRLDLDWTEILPRTKLSAHTQHYFQKELDFAVKEKSYDYFRLKIFPDGGVSRLRIYGKIVT